jgi:uncharacterized protein YecE (DUF72 family)
MYPDVRIGCAGWSIPSQKADDFPAAGTHLQRYAARFSAVEINSSFDKPHRRRTYEDWAVAVPSDFRFSVKMSRQITHDSRLADLSAIGFFLPNVMTLNEKLGPLLMQLPPSLTFDIAKVSTFLSALRDRFAGDIVCEARHSSWFTPEADRLLVDFRVARVAADPAPVPQAAEPGGWSGLIYYRLHGWPQMYYSAYDSQFIETMAARLAGQTGEAPVWCIFDNTAWGEATGNALALMRAVSSKQ